MSKEARVHVAKAIESDIELGYGIPISIPGIYKLKDAEVYPLGLQTQQTIDEAGRSIPKKRLTHDLSHNREKGCSVNQRIDISSMPRATYGHTLSRFLHFIHHLRWSFPNEQILCNKIDIEKAYRRLHASAKAAAKCIAIWHPDEAKRPEDGIGVLLSRLPFGSSPAPPGFCTISEAVFDLADDLLNCPLWDPEELPSPQADLLHDPEPPGDNTPFGVAMEADVKLDPNCKGGTDGFIDDGACAVLASPSNSRMVARGAQATLMSLFLVFRPLAAALEPMKRPDPPSMRKLEAEGMLREVITFLGWKIDTRAFTISLPEDKWINWRNEITMCLTRPHVTPEVLASLVGRLNHVCFVIPDARHFRNHLRKMKQVAESVERSIRISLGARKDLQLWLQFLEYAAKGISINLVVFRKPTLQSLSDASPWGIGGLSLTTLVGWRHKFTELKQRSFTMNCKEHIGVVVDSIIQAKHDTSKADFPCYLH